jgi:hypothetical protein
MGKKRNTLDLNEFRTRMKTKLFCLLDLQARSLLSSSLWESLIDPHLNGDYMKEEMEIMISVARLCLAHSSSRRPMMKTVNFLISLHINKLHLDFEAQLYVLNSTFIILCSRSRLDFFLIGDGLDFDS